MNDMDAQTALWQLGGVADYAALTRWGVSRLQVRRDVERGAVHRVRNGWFAASDAPADLVAAVRIGGALSCVSALRRAHIWCLDDRRLHVCVGQHAPYVGSPQCRSIPLGDPTVHGVALHRGYRHRSGALVPACELAETALAHLFTCKPRDDVIAAIDSALNKRLITGRELRLLSEHLPQKYAPYFAAVDSSAQSGTETFVRLRLRRLKISYRTQVDLAGVGRVDFVVGERFVIEVDSRAWYAGDEAFAEDRRRDLQLHALGYVVLRLSYWQVITQLDDVVTVIRSIVSRGEHRWAGRHRHRGLGLPTASVSAVPVGSR